MQEGAISYIVIYLLQLQLLQDCSVRKITFVTKFSIVRVSIILYYLYFKIIFHILHIYFHILIKKCKRCLVILKHYRLFIKALLNYNLKMAS